MGVQVEEKGSKQINVELNLVPFIDLMSMCICFLLITAVWTQVSMIQIGSSIYGKKQDNGQVDQPKKDDFTLKLDINNQGYVLSTGRQSFRIPKKGITYDTESLLEQLKNIKTRAPDKSDATISILDEIKFDELIHGMDALMTAGFPEIGIATQGSQ